ncbi:MAG: hypothetical protein PHF18_15410 [Methanosarcina sp.]|uniref:hypothetical protein n=1 Tax=Methanosarcina sp. TaxID=2213 RepID=UPI0026275276|nr:hypothetical protein [Methanosarcina sp.]MDD3248215.1 hypothetical protein [Methanosarcina sp.]
MNEKTTYVTHPNCDLGLQKMKHFQGVALKVQPTVILFGIVAALPITLNTGERAFQEGKLRREEKEERSKIKARK